MEPTLIAKSWITHDVHHNWVMYSGNQTEEIAGIKDKILTVLIRVDERATLGMVVCTYSY